MPMPRKSLIDLLSTSYYHIICRCVRRAFLCGEDKLTGKSFEHRREWLVDRFKFLAKNFTIDICAYAVMSNHYHLVLKVDEAQSLALSDKEVVKRWTAMYKGAKALIEPLLLSDITDIQKETAKSIIKVWRNRLSDISWLMRCLNEYIARKANKEDDCTGHFWESRFKSQALLDDTALLSCMVYVDLNPVRAGIAQDLPSSDFTSIQERIRAFEKPYKKYVDRKKHSKLSPLQPKSMLPFGTQNKHSEIHFMLVDYLALADWTGRCVNPNKKGHISKDVPKLVQVLDIEEADWLEMTQQFEKKFAGFAGNSAKLYTHACDHGQSRYRGVG